MGFTTILINKFNGYGILIPLKVAVISVSMAIVPSAKITDDVDTENENFVISQRNIWCDHSIESSLRDDSNECHIIGFR